MEEVKHKKRQDMTKKELATSCLNLARRQQNMMDIIDAWNPTDKLSERERNMKQLQIRSVIFSTIAMLKHVSGELLKD